LNSINGRGLLVLGIEAPDEVATEIKGVDKTVLKQLKTQFSLESFINAKIRSIPQYSNDFMLKTKEIEYENGTYVYLIEVKRENSYCVYYSGVTENAYRRQNHKSIPLKLNEILELVANNNYPQIFVSLNDIGIKTNKRDKSTFVRLPLKYQNYGPSPTEDANIMVFLCSNDSISIKSRFSRFTFKDNLLDLHIYNLNFDKSNYNKKYGFEYFVHVNKRIIYPFKAHLLDSFMVKYKGNVDFDLYILCLENRGVTKQKFSINVNSDVPSFTEEIREFRPYVTL
jgi:hypothetical protein